MRAGPAPPTGSAVEGWVDAAISVADADRIGQRVADQVGAHLPDLRSFTWTARSV